MASALLLTAPLSALNMDGAPGAVVAATHNAGDEPEPPVAPPVPSDVTSCSAYTGPPSDVMAQFGTDAQRAAFKDLWDKIPVHVRGAKFTMQGNGWTLTVIESLRDVLITYEHPFSKHTTDLGHCLLDPFSIKLKEGSKPVAF